MKYETESKNFYKKMIRRRFIYELLLYRQYRENDKESLIQIFHSSLDNWNLSDEEIKEIIVSVKKEMLKEYRLEIINDNPLVFKERYEIFTNPFDIF